MAKSNLTRCQNGHLFSKRRYGTVCPYCNIETATKEKQETGRTEVEIEALKYKVPAFIMYFISDLLISNNRIQQYSGCACPHHHINGIYFPFPQNKKTNCKNNNGNHVDSTQISRQNSFSVKRHDY